MTVGVADLFHRRGIGGKPVGDDVPRPAIFLHDALQKLQRRSLVSLRGHHRFQDLAFVIDGMPEIAELAVDLHEEVSGAGEFRPRALSEPDVILSHHPAPIVRPLSYGFALSMRVLPSPVDLTPELNNATPSLQPITGPSSLLRVAPPLCPASVLSPS